MDETPAPKPKSLFRNRNFSLTFLGALVSNVASLFYSFAVSFYILRITGNNALIQGLYLAIGGVTFCVSTLFGGVIGDRFNKAKIMYICDYLKGAVIIGFTLLLMFVIHSETGQVVALFIVAVLSNVLAGIFTPASAALLPQIVEEDRFQQAQSYFSILNSFQSIFGVVLAGVMYTLVPINTLFLIVGGCYIASAISEMFIRYEGIGEKRDEKLTLRATFRDIKEGFVYLSAIKPIMVLMVCILFINFFISPVFDNFVPYFVATDLEGTQYLFHEAFAPEMWSSFLSMAIGIGSLVMGIVLSTRKQMEKCNVVVRFSILALAVIVGLLALFYGLFAGGTLPINSLLIIMLVGCVSIGVTLVLVNVPSSTAMMRIVDKDKFGKVSSVLNIGSQGLIPVATFLGGVALSSIGSVGLLGVCAGGLLVTALVLFFARPIREL
ncbi:MAG: MFS transporter [Bacilli bacterium]|nr:MFS transporter [Bacilli bacterium]